MTIQLLEVAGATDEQVRRRVATWQPGGYVAAYDPELGMSSLVVTGDRDQALWLDSGEALTMWRSSPSSDPIRPDGRPNRPLTAFTVAIT